MRTYNILIEDMGRPAVYTVQEGTLARAIEDDGIDFLGDSMSDIEDWLSKNYELVKSMAVKIIYIDFTTGF